MTAPFGFSVGDFLAVIGLTVKIYDAIDGSSDSLAEFHETSGELKVFNGVLQQLQESMTGYFSSGVATSPPSASPAATAFPSDASGDTGSAFQLLAQTKAVLESSNKTLTKFHAFIESYKGARSVRQRLNYVLFGRKKLEPFRARLQRDVFMLGMLQQEINRRALHDLREQVDRNSKDIGLRIQRGTKDVKVHVTGLARISDEPVWDNKPIHFQDAMGRRYPIPLEVCHGFEGLLQFLKFAFKDSPLLKSIERRDIWLFAPGGGNVTWWYLIRGEGDWARILRPGLRLGMSLLPRSTFSLQRTSTYRILATCRDYSQSSFSVDSGTLHNGQVTNCVESMVRFTKPLPTWATYPEDLEFRYFDREPASLKPNLVEVLHEVYAECGPSFSRRTTDGIVLEDNTPSEADLESKYNYYTNTLEGTDHVRENHGNAGEMNDEDSDDERQVSVNF